MNEEIDRMLKLDIIEKALSTTWLSPVVIVKKANGGIRLCLDARKLNEHTVTNSYPQRNANRILRQIQGTKFLSSLDLSDAYYQVKICPETRNHTAFAVSARGTYRYKRMANGLCNGGSTLCELIENILGCDLEPNVFPYMDDFIVCTDSFKRHMEILTEVARRLKPKLVHKQGKNFFFFNEANIVLGVHNIRPRYIPRSAKDEADSGVLCSEKRQRGETFRLYDGILPQIYPRFLYHRRIYNRMLKK